VTNPNGCLPASLAIKIGPSGGRGETALATRADEGYSTIYRVDGQAAALEAERPQLPHELNEELEPSRHVPAAGVVQVKPAAQRSPIGQHDP
jgi:hypothetical protein